ncbi:hypothetical protein [Mangrovibacterium lignilyticum]|uniref:hypothetical protein n=1 Tax=Mangrovibacterium lignilyticum TaxID=2668052 RepID=UPI0013D760C4|nr:hypothetical protein [Mangrovibacterium lignilyticum]
MEESKKLFSQKAIAIATFFGGPAAAGYLIKKNYEALGQEEQGKTAFVIGLVSTLLLLLTLLSIPEAVSDKIPNALIPAIYSGIIYLLVEKIQGSRIAAYEAGGGEFHSGWKAAGIGAVFMGLLAILLFGSLYLSGNLYSLNFDTERYDREVATFVENEKNALAIFDVMETTPLEKITRELAKGTILWKENKEALHRVASIENLPEELLQQNEKLVHYCDLRIAHNEYIIRALSENTNAYDQEIERIGTEIGQILEEMN